MLELHERPFESAGLEMTLTEFTADGRCKIELIPADNDNAAISHVLDCVTPGTPDTLLTARAATESLRLALDIHHSLTAT